MRAEVEEAAQDMERVIALVGQELARATYVHGPMASAHEGYAVIREELDELWDEVKSRSQHRSRLRTEAIQTAAMCLRFILDLGLLEEEADD